MTASPSVVYGNWEVSDMPNPSQWYVRDSGWNRWLFRNANIKRLAAQYWESNRDVFGRVLDSIDYYAARLNPMVVNDFKRWPILGEKGEFPFRESFNSYMGAVDSLKAWITQRYAWIDNALGF